MAIVSPGKDHYRSDDQRTGCDVPLLIPHPIPECVRVYAPLRHGLKRALSGSGECDLAAFRSRRATWPGKNCSRLGTPIQVNCY